MNIIGEYKFKIFKDKDWYIAEGKTPDKKRVIITQGKTPEEIFDMITDAYLCAFEIKVSWWNKFLSKLIRYK